MFSLNREEKKEEKGKVGSGERGSEKVGERERW